MKIWLTIATILFSFGVAGCNTISGAGQDIEAAGEAIEEAAEDVKDDMSDGA